MAKELRSVRPAQARETHLGCVRVVYRSVLGRSPAIEVSGSQPFGILSGAVVLEGTPEKSQFAGDNRWYTDSHMMREGCRASSTLFKFNLKVNGCTD